MLHHFKIYASTFALGLALFACPLAARAGVVNGGFETGNFTGWQRIGNTSIQTAAFGSGPTEGKFEALLTTAGDTASAASLDVFLGLAANTLENMGFTSGSAIKQTFTASAGDPISFDANFLTNASQQSADQQAFTFALLPGSSTPIPLLLATPADATDSSATPFASETGFQAFADVAPLSGTYSLAFAVLSQGQVTTTSGLLVDNLNVAGSTGAGNGGGGGSGVPLPAAAWTAMIAVSGAAGLRKRIVAG
jgi:hypothetical protein